MSTKESAAATNGGRKEEAAPYDPEAVIVYISSRIEELCAKKDISKYRVSARSGVPSGNIGRYADGSRVPTIETIAKLCFGFDITLSEFFEKMPGREKTTSSDPRDILLEIWEELDQNGQKSLLSFGRYLADSQKTDSSKTDFQKTDSKKTDSQKNK